MARPCSFVRAAFAGVAILAAPGIVFAQESKLDFGKREYALHCAVCHGLTGNGDGYYNQTLRRPSDLTILAKKNKGVFPYQRLYQAIDGRQEIEAHGTRDMPIWGTYYQAIGVEDNSSATRNPKAYARTRIKALIDYIHQLQVK